MKISNKIIFVLGIFLLGLTFQSCQDLEVENLNEPDRARALSEAADLLSLLEGGYSTFYEFMTDRGNHVFDGYSDQTTGTNAYYDWWYFAQEPKNRIPNTSTWANKQLLDDPWADLNSCVYAANMIILSVAEGVEIVLEDGTDETQKALAGAYFLRGIAQGYLGMFFDKAYIVNEDTDLGALEFSTASELIAAGVASIELAKSVISAQGVTNDFLLDTELSSADYLKLANSMAARLLISEPRNSAQAADVDWQAVYDYANAGIDFDWAPLSSDELFSIWHLVQSYEVNGGAGHYQHTDLKVINLMDPSYPIRYPASGMLDAATSNDDRLLSDWIYDADFGFLTESRGRELFSNYAYLRWGMAEYNAGVYAGNETPLFLKAENDLIKAEALVELGQVANAQAILDDASNARIARGGLDALPAGSSADVVMDAIYYEYCVELYATGKGVQWLGMRRWDLLQEGTALQLPIPAGELETTGDELYSFGGVPFADGTGTADGATSWDKQ